MTTDNREPDPPGQWLAGETAPAAPPPAKRPASQAGRSICGNCGSIGTPKKTAPGSFLVELALWLCFLVPGIIYSLWRVSTKQPACRSCGALHSMVPLHSPRGRQLAAEFKPTTSSD